MNTQSSVWTVKQASITAALCFAIGVGIGFVAHGPAVPKVSASTAAPMMAASMPPSVPESTSIAPPISTPNPTPDQLKAASRQATVPVLEQLQKDPKNFKLLVQVAERYYHHGAFADATPYYKRALDVEDNPLVRNQYASTLYYQGDADGALAQYGRVLDKLPTNDVALFNVGMIRLKAKKDPKGAVESWNKLLKAYPNHPQREKVQSLIDRASKQSA